MPSESALPPIVAVVGATAAGKTGLSLDVAERLRGEIVNTDAMAVYREMDVGTAKLPPAERRGIPHHLVDHLDVTESWTVAQHQRDARAAVADVRARGGVPVLADGQCIGGVGVSGGDWETDLKIAQAAVESIGASWK